MSEHIAATIADCEQKIGAITQLLEQLRWFQREFPHTAAAMVPIPTKRRGPKPGPKAGRVAKSTNGTAPPAAAVQKRIAQSTGSSRTGMASPASSEIVQARDAAIISRLKKGPAASATLTDVMPTEPGLSDEQKAHACRNALTRLRVKKLVKQDAAGNWMIA